MTSILIVDDNEDLASSMRGFLEGKGNTVKSANCGKDAYDILDAEDFDLLILDWELPDASGPDICQYYRKFGGLGAVLMLTGRNSSEDKVTGLNAGADDYLTKPVNIPEFSARIDALLRRVSMIKKEEPPTYDESMVGKTFAATYMINAVLGKGAMGIVYHATHTTLKRSSAVKVLTDHPMQKGDRKRFEREARAMSLLDHPSLVKIYDFGFADQRTPYIVMEFIEGRTLNEILKEQGKLSVKEAIPVFIGICEGLHHAHLQSIIHRDLKPANVMVSNSGQCKILDLGVAKISEEETDMKLTVAGEIFGSPYYMSPEQALSKALDHRSDIYSLGCLMFEVLTGELPFMGDSFVELVNAKTKATQPPSICQHDPQAKFPPALDKLLMKTLEKSPANRPNSMTQIIEELNTINSSIQNGAAKEKSELDLLSYVRKLWGKS